jgi:hypothetical protein
LQGVVDTEEANESNNKMSDCWPVSDLIYPQKPRHISNNRTFGGPRIGLLILAQYLILDKLAGIRHRLTTYMYATEKI